jgi:hypothetical protein
MHVGRGGGLVRFADYHPLPERMCGHSPGSHWFCREHLEAAQELAHLGSSSALAELQSRFGVFAKPELGPVPVPSLWVTAVGPHPARVLAVYRRVSGLPAAAAFAGMRSGPFEVTRGWARELERLRDELAALGADAEIRYG